MLCPSCHTENRSERRFCHACASPLAASTCPSCSFVNHPGERFCGGCAVEVARADEARAVPSSPALETSAERRQMTVMFCDMVGSTALSAELDAEDLRDLLTRFQRACVAAIEHFDGFIARYMGDGMLVYFGYPHAHEDSAERAVRAGLAIVTAVGTLEPRPVRPRVRIGIATGRVVVGDLIGEGVSEERAVVGETPNLAARLQGLAEPDTVVISARTRRLVGDSFDLEDLGHHALKGFPEPVPAWRARGLARQRGASGPADSSATPLIGRTFELSLLHHRWTALRGGEGGVVALAGDTGLGKNRLVSRFIEEIREASDEGAAVVRYQCARHHENTVLYPVVEQISRAAGIDLRDPMDARLAKVRLFVETWSSDVDRDTAAVGRILSLEQDDEATSPEDRRREMLATVDRYLHSHGIGTPVLAVFEDAQWADPTTLELISQRISRGATEPVMVVVTHRSGFEPPWRGAAGLTSLSLGRLQPEVARELVRAMDADRQLERQVVDTILERGDGVPGFLIELTRAVLARRSTGDSDGPLDRSPVPETLQDSLAAQLDRLGGARTVAQTAAVIGRTVPRDLLARICGLPEPTLTAHLDKLVQAGVLLPPDGQPGSSYLFRRELLRELAYESLLRSDRRRLHDRIATILLTELPDAAQADLVSTARHLGGADRAWEAGDWWARAAERSTRQGSWPETASHWRCAVACAEPALDPSDAAACQVLAERLIELAQTLRLVGDPQEALALLDRAEDLATPHALYATLSHANFSRGNLYFNLDNVAACAAAHQRALELAQRSGSALAEVRALGGLADVELLGGDRVAAAELGERCVNLAVHHGFDRIAAANAAAASFAYYWSLRPEPGLRMAQIAEELGTKTGHPRARVIAQNGHALIAAGLGDAAGAQRALALRDRALGPGLLHGQLLFVDYRVAHATGGWKEAHAVMARGLEVMARSEREAVTTWFTACRAYLLAEAEPESVEGILAEIYQGLEGAAPNRLNWAAMGIIEALIHRRNWPALETAIDRFASMADVERVPRLALWVETGRTALQWSANPADPAVKAAVDRVVERAREGGAASVERVLAEMVGEGS